MKVELAATQKALASEQKTKASMDDIVVEDLPSPDSKKSDPPDKPRADHGRILTLEEQLKALGKRRWWQVWKSGNVQNSV